LSGNSAVRPCNATASAGTARSGHTCGETCGLDGAKLDDAMAVRGVKASRLGIDDDFTHHSARLAT
jgi:hypothetical protein